MRGAGHVVVFVFIFIVTGFASFGRLFSWDGMGGEEAWGIVGKGMEGKGRESGNLVDIGRASSLLCLFVVVIFARMHACLCCRTRTRNE